MVLLMQYWPTCCARRVEDLVVQMALFGDHCGFTMGRWYEK